MTVGKENRTTEEDVRSAQDPEPPPVRPAGRPTIEPTDAMPSEGAGQPGILHEVTSSFREEDDEGSDTSAPRADAAAEPSPPPVDPADRPTIEPADAMPTDR